MYNYAAAQAKINELIAPPPPGTPHGVAIPGSERPNRSQIYRHWQFTNQPLLETLDPAVTTLQDLFESSAQRFPNNKCLGVRKWLQQSQTWDNKFTWMTYSEVAQRRKHFGAGLVEIHREAKHEQEKNYPIALWSPNQPEWQLVGKRKMKIFWMRALICSVG